MRLGIGPLPTQLLAISITFVSLGALAFEAGYPATNDDLRGMVAMKCSGVLVRLGRGADQPAVLLSSGRCATTKSIPAGEAVVNVPFDRSEISLYEGLEAPETVKANRVLYATRTGTDVALIELKLTYRDLEARGAKIYELAATDAKPDSDVQLIAGQWQEKQLCAVSHIVSTLVEDVWTETGAYALKDPCPTPNGWAGTPMLDPTTLKVVGILNTTNVAGALCTLDNPCEVENGNRLAFAGRTYGQRISPILDCLTDTGELDLGRATCKLTKPKLAPTPRSSPTPPRGKPTSAWPRHR